MQTGTRIYYTGDQANSEGRGVVAKYHPAGKYNAECVDIEFDDGRRFAMVFVAGFSPGPGRRFWLLDEWQEDRQKRVAEYLATIEGKVGAV
jgi:hypothetical protein